MINNVFGFFNFLASLDFFILIAFISTLFLSLVLTKLFDRRVMLLPTIFLFSAMVWKMVSGFFEPVNHLVTEQMATLASLFIDHRALILVAPPFFLLIAIIILVVYKENIKDRHAKEYRKIIIFSIAVSFFLFLVSMIESWF